MKPSSDDDDVLYQDLDGPLILSGRKRANEDSLNDTEQASPSSHNKSFDSMPLFNTESPHHNTGDASSHKRQRQRLPCYSGVKQININEERDEIKALKAKIASLTAENQTLKRNMSILFRTAKIELGRLQRAGRN